MIVDKPIKFEFTATNRRGIMVLPKNCVPYIIFLDGTHEHSSRKIIRNAIVKKLLTLAETVARW